MSAVVLRGDARSLPLPDASVDLVVTSPPYWSLRDYRDGGKSLAGQIGSEETWQEYITNLLDCTREWVRVLKPSGSIFVNLGDKYANDAKWGGATSGKHVAGLHGKSGIGRARVRTGIAPKSLIGLPQRYMIGCIDQLGLIVREDDVWHKVSALPESVDDRCARRHEYVFHITKQPHYFAAVDEIREPQTGSKTAHSLPGFTTRDSNDGLSHRAMRRDPEMFNPLGKLPGSVWEIPGVPLFVPESLGTDHYAAFPPQLPRKCILGWSPSGICVECGQGRWPVTLASRQADGQPVSGTWQTESNGHALGPQGIGHWRFATVRRHLGYACACTPYTDHPASGQKTQRRDYDPALNGANPQGTYGRKQAGEYERVDPWREYHLDRWVAPPTRPALVVDAFGGTGTTALVADVLGRNGMSFDLSADYCRIARWRTRDPAERARALGVPKPPPVPDGQAALFDPLDEAS